MASEEDKADGSRFWYIVQSAPKSFCPHCNVPVDLLCPEEDPGVMFYICWDCKKIYQVGLREVPREKET